MARAVILVATVVALILVAEILLVVLKANRSNDIVQFVRDASRLPRRSVRQPLRGEQRAGRDSR